MTKLTLKLIIPSMFGFLTACATTPDPAEICSAEWIAPRAERAMNEFKKDTRPTIKRLAKIGDKLNDGDTIGPLQMFSLMNSINSLSDKFENGRAMRDMRTLADNCSDPELIKNAMTDYLEEQGVSEQFINFLNNMQVYQELLKTGEKPDMKIERS
jgi:hypothetical protein